MGLSTFEPGCGPSPRPRIGLGTSPAKAAGRAAVVTHVLVVAVERENGCRSHTNPDVVGSDESHNARWEIGPYGTMYRT